MNLFESLAEHGIRPRSMRGGDHKLICPKCSDGRTNKSDPCLSLTISGDGPDERAVWKCHHCSWVGWVGTGRWARIKDAHKKQYKRPQVVQVPPQQSVLGWFDSRAIPAHIVAEHGIWAAMVWMPQSGAQEKVICFPSVKDGVIVNVKYREPKRKWFRQESDAEPAPFGHDDIAGQKEIWIVEGEIDKLSLAVVGIKNCISVPAGAPNLNKDGSIPILPEDSKKFAWMDIVFEHIEAAERVVIAVDADGPGRVLQSELIRRIGREKCWVVDWPCLGENQINDANALLMMAGEEALLAVLDQARAVPAEGEVTVSDMWADIEQMHVNQTIQWYSTGFKSLDDVYRVLRGQITVLTGFPHDGKALALDTPIPTPTGWTTMGAIQPGDMILDDAGKPCRVLRATGVMIGKPCYRVGFAYGDPIVACEDHKWFTADKQERSSIARQARRGEGLALRGNDQRAKARMPQVRTTAQIAASLMVNGSHANHAVPLTPSLDLPDAELIVPPYTMGAWLGDGTTSSGSITCPDAEVLAGIRRDGFTVTDRSVAIHHGVLGLMGRLRTAGVLGAKHIPLAYLRASRDQRLALLQGLVDTDGYVLPTGMVEITTVLPALVPGILELLRSLGQSTRGASEGRAMLNGRDCGPKWRIMFRPTLSVATVARKAASLPKCALRRGWNQISSCDLVPSVPVRCIEVDSPSHLFLAGTGMIPTHNSSFLDQVMVNMALKSDWRFAIYSPETDPPRHVINLIEKAAQMPFFSGPARRLDWPEVNVFRPWLEDHFRFLRWERKPDKPGRPDIKWIIKQAEYMVRRYGIDGLVVDPFNRISAGAGFAREMDFVLDLLDELQALAKRTSIHVWIVAHPAKQGRDRNGKRTEKLTLQDVSGAAHWDNCTDMGLLVRRVWEHPDGEKYEPRETPVEVECLKARDKHSGKKGGSALFKWNFVDGTYREIDRLPFPAGNDLPAPPGQYND